MNNKMTTRWKKIGVWCALLAVCTFLLPSVALADAVVGETVVTLGANLTPEQRQQILKEMGVSENEVQVLEVTNAEEHKYLGNYMSKAMIGTRAISSAKITLTKGGSGINVDTNNVELANSIYANALVTAGVKDADVYVTAPVLVSGTAGLTGIIKAFEVAMDETISEEQKQVANEEMVKTGELGETYGEDKIADLMMRLKEEIAKNKPESKEEMKQLIINVAGDMNINLNNADVDKINDLMMRISKLDIDWDQLKNQVDQVRNNLGDMINSEEGRNFLQKALDAIVSFFKAIIDWFASLFGGGSDSALAASIVPPAPEMRSAQVAFPLPLLGQGALSLEQGAPATAYGLLSTGAGSAV
ncbi:DUF1002 domain-containing protein [Numidum massiliense]|uniref:DUF1002 domain-containing protein n=1 Tax=Numidum massiliense TaxID=1522315 RepID=UPI00093BCBD5|nr:DUF1002 domain-containing protein [Numidum massiliense]